MSRYERASLGDRDSAHEGWIESVRSFVDMPKLVKYVVEFGAAFALVLFVGAIEDDQKSVVTTSAAYGMTTALLMLMFSAQHFNAWLTLYAFAMDLMQARTPPSPGKVFLGIANVISIIGVQIAGSIFGAWFLSFLHNDAQRVGVTVPADHMNAGDTIVWEFIGSFLHFMASESNASRIASASKYNHNSANITDKNTYCFHRMCFSYVHHDATIGGRQGFRSTQHACDQPRAHISASRCWTFDVHRVFGHYFTHRRQRQLHSKHRPGYHLRPISASRIHPAGSSDRLPRRGLGVRLAVPHAAQAIAQASLNSRLCLHR